ncbi:hypothetical protein ACFQZO_00170 [Bradyrhizobium sp. GCM10027634]|uniref:hypothetical protein n=1 Tax=unclassified Bradyrhizobium TaxID=2631580 RepID=UPI00188B6A00|nr:MULTISPECIES: hypothetical protein [unclassified Bradyrhizobium]MDN4999292.1 hypothetical protein [Bradyrhizobium sp. WYCCWR 12677]
MARQTHYGRRHLRRDYRRHPYADRAREDRPSPPVPQEIAVAVEHHYRMGTTVEDVDAIVNAAGINPKCSPVRRGARAISTCASYVATDMTLNDDEIPRHEMSHPGNIVRLVETALMLPNNAELPARKADPRWLDVLAKIEKTSGAVGR